MVARIGRRVQGGEPQPALSAGFSAAVRCYVIIVEIGVSQGAREV